MAKAKKEEILKQEAEAMVGEEIDELKDDQQSLSDQGQEIEAVQSETDTSDIKSAEAEAVNTDNETAKEATKSAKKKPAKKSSKPAKKSKRSSSYMAKVELVERSKKYSISEAVELVKKLSTSKFDGTVNLAVRLEKTKKAEDAIRGTIKLVHGTGKKQKVEIVSEELIEKIKKGVVDFDILVATPSMMPKLGALAKILGPKGKMPNPKDGTVVDDPKAVIEDLSEKIVRYRADAGRNIHMPVGKISWENNKLVENIAQVLKSLSRLKKESATISPTMGPGVKIDVK
jgi:large subunit ribosomal protein L1